MKSLASWLLVIASIAGYFVLSTLFGVYQRHPALSYLGCAAGCVLLAVLLRRRFTRWRLAGLVSAAALTALFVWYTQVYSTYAPHATAIAQGADLGDELAGLTLPDQSGAPTAVLASAAAADATLLVFYRGFW